MFDVGFSELILLAVVALVVLGPEKLPHAARMAGAWMGRIRRTVTSIQMEIEKEVAASEFRDRMNQEIERLKAAANPLEEELKSVENTIRQNLEHTPESSIASLMNAPDATQAQPRSPDAAITVPSTPEAPEAISTSALTPIALPASDDNPTPAPVNLIKSPPL